ncbi:MAG: DUF790 family protein [Candidatus Thorarchaeota archaeon]
MVLRLQYLKYQVKGRQMVPYFLAFPFDQALPQKLIEYFEEHLGKPRALVNFDTPLRWAPDNRVVRALFATLFNRFYSFVSNTIDNLVEKNQLDELRRQGIASLEEFRLWYWEFIQKQYGGYFPRDKRHEVFTAVGQSLKLSVETVQLLLTAHRDEEMLLHRQNDCPSAEELIGAYNYEVLETLLYNSDDVNLSIMGSSLGTTARFLLKHTKRYGVLVDLESSNEALHAIITGPRVFFGRATSFGWNIAQVITHLLQDAPALEINVNTLTIDVLLRNRHYTVNLDSETFPHVIPRDPIRQDEAFLDSKVEKQFYWSWQNNKFRGWDIVREPEAFIFGSHIIIPDFALIKGDYKVLIEIIGYWREEYTQKKQAQLKLLKQQGLQHMILLVDTKHQSQFINSEYPVVFYRTRGIKYDIPYGKILKVLPE